MKICIIAICIAILLGILGCGDTASGSQNDTSIDMQPLDEEKQLYSEENGSQEIISSSYEKAFITNISGEKTSNENLSGEMSLEPAESISAPSALIPAVMIDGTIYYLSQGYPIPDEEIGFEQIGYTESEVSMGIFPGKEGESNYAPVGTLYVKHENGYALKIEEYGWTLFLTWEERLKHE